jgi:fermentation-respiration switch protein FrsA (DUF1100 family)
MQIQPEVQSGNKKVWQGWLIASALVIFLGANGIGLFLGNQVYEEASLLHSQLNAPSSSQLQQQLEIGKKTRQWEDVVIESRFAYSLKGTFIPNPHPTDKTLIFLHGFTDNRLAGLSYVSFYLKNGYNLLLIDSRAHGESGGSSVTWGVYEKQDLDQWVDWIRQRFPSGQIGVHGLSMGAATALMHAELNEKNKRVAFYIADSSYSDFETLLKLQLRQRLPQVEPLFLNLLLPYVNLVAYFQAGFTFYQASPLQAVRQVTTPILYLHGEADKLIPVSMSQALYQATSGPKQIVTFPKREHIQAAYQERQQYDQVIQEFIRSLELHN